MDKLLTKLYSEDEVMSPSEIAKLDIFLSKLTPWQYRAIREFYCLGPRFIERKYGINPYDMLTNVGILEVE